jgi:two-component system sensor histidine kinase UhpB
VFAVVLVIVFSVEGAIMLALPALPQGWRNSTEEGLLDAAALTLITAPAVWLLLVLPLRRSLEARGQLLRRLFDSQERERSRLARELHDGVGQNLTALLIGLRRVTDAGDLETAGQRAHDLQDLVSEAHAEVRTLARGLHPVVLEEHGLVEAVERLCNAFERTHDIRVQYTSPTQPAARFHPVAEAALYRIAQEALANVARHADAKSVEVSLEVGPRSVQLVVHDDGVGIGPRDGGGSSEAGFGLSSIRERALLLGGRCRVRSKPGRGTTIDVRAPVES